MKIETSPWEFFEMKWTKFPLGIQFDQVINFVLCFTCDRIIQIFRPLTELSKPNKVMIEWWAYAMNEHIVVSISIERDSEKER